MIFDREKLLFEGDTKFDHYQVLDMIYEGRKARVLFTGNRSAAFSGIPLDENSDLLFDYIQRFFELTATIRPKHLLMIGGGVYTLPTALVQALPDIKIDVVEIDEGLDPIAEAFFGYEPSKRLKIIHDDGRHYLETCKQKYDMIIIDAFTHLRIPPSLAGKDMPSLIKQRLTEEGILAMNIISAYKGRRAAVIEHFFQMYSEHFKDTRVYPADSSQSLWSSQNFVLVSDLAKIVRDQGLRFGELPPPAYPKSGAFKLIDS